MGRASGDGVVYATTVIRQRPPASSHNVASIDLAEGPRIMSRVGTVDPAQVRIGMRVKARIAREADASIVVFDPADASSNLRHSATKSPQRAAVFPAAARRSLAPPPMASGERPASNQSTSPHTPA